MPDDNAPRPRFNVVYLIIAVAALVFVILPLAFFVMNTLGGLACFMGHHS